MVRDFGLMLLGVALWNYLPTIWLVVVAAFKAGLAWFTGGASIAPEALAEKALGVAVDKASAGFANILKGAVAAGPATEDAIAHAVALASNIASSTLRAALPAASDTPAATSAGLAAPVVSPPNAAGGAPSSPSA